MKELEESLKRISDQVAELTEIAKRTEKSGRSFAYMESFKRVEDGILDAIHTATEGQIESLIKYRQFVYYDEYNDEETLMNEIKTRRRNAKLNDIGI